MSGKCKTAALIVTIIAALSLFNGCAKSVNEPVPMNVFPNSPYPADGATDVPLPLTLTWRADNAAAYDVLFDDVNPPVKSVASASGVDTLQMKSLQYLKQYFWKVTVKGKDGFSYEGNVWRFMTKSRYTNQPGFLLKQYYLDVTAPCFVNIMFQVTDPDGRGIENLSKGDFTVLEDGSTVSPTESAMNIRKKEDIPYTFKTVLMLDNSASVAADLPKIKEAAISLINTITVRQEIALYVFSDAAVMLQDFTANKQTLINAVNSITAGFATTNLYGAGIEGLKRWKNIYTIDRIEQGALILVTDGSDTQGLWTLSDVLNARGDKRVYTVGLGNEIDPNVLQQIGNSGFYAASDVTQLNAKLQEIQTEIAKFAGSFYWLNYMSPKRGDREHSLELKIPGNPYSGGESTIAGSFNSKSFYSVNAGLYIQPTSTQPYGLETLYVNHRDTIEVSAVTYLGSNAPSYSWTLSNTGAARFISGYEAGATTKIYAVGLVGTTSTLTVRDEANSLTKSIPVVIADPVFPPNIYSYYPCNNSLADVSGNGINATGTSIEYRTDHHDLAFGAAAITSAGANIRIPPVTVDSLSVSLWYYSEPAGSGLCTLLDDIAPGTSHSYLLYDRSTGKLGFRTGGVLYSTLASFQGGTWNHLVVVKNKDNVKIYLNKKMVCDYSPAFFASAYPLEVIGSSGAVNNPGYGRYDDICIYKRALTELEVQSLYKLQR